MAQQDLSVRSNPLFERVVHARLPAAAGRAEMFDHVAAVPHGDRLFARRLLRPTPCLFCLSDRKASRSGIRRFRRCFVNTLSSICRPISCADICLDTQSPPSYICPIPKRVPISQPGDGTVTDRLSPVEITFKQCTIQAGDVLFHNVKKSS